MEIIHEVILGQILINEITHVINRDDVHVFEIDLRSKYPGTVAYSDGGPNRIGILLFAGENTLYSDKTTDRPTEIIFHGDFKGHWAVFGDGARYTQRVCLYWMAVES